MRYDYAEHDGSEFPTPDSLFPTPQLMQFIMLHGQDALDAMQELEGDEEQQYLDMLVEARLLEPYEDEDGQTKYRMTPRMVSGMQHRALLDVFQNMRKGQRPGHDTTQPGSATQRSQGTQPYQFGDPLSEIDLAQTMRNALARHHQSEPVGSVPLPLQLSIEDLERHQTESQTDCDTVMLIDLSGSMMRYGRFLKAKQVAMGMSAMIRAQFPLDTLRFVSFYSMADIVQERDMPLIMPKPVSLFDPVVKLRVPLKQAREQMDQMPLHFTNLQLGLRQARRMLTRSGAANKQIFIITDGQPTAHVETSHAGEEMLYLLYPPTQETTDITLREALRCHQQGIRLTSFALTEDYFGMGWVSFIERMTRLTRGTAFYCSGEDLGSTVIESYIHGKRKKSFIA